MRKSLIFLFTFAVLTLFISIPSYSFSTFRKFGGTVHQNVSSSALPALGISEKSFQIIDDGNTSMDDVLRHQKKFVDSSHHCDNERIDASFRYINNNYKSIAEKIGQAHKDKKALEYVLYTFGELLHPIQDFYSHSNYAELYLKKNPNATPSDIPILGFKPEETPMKPEETTEGIKSGFFFYDSALNNEATRGRDVSYKNISLHNKSLKFFNTKEYEEMVKTFEGYINYATDPEIHVLHYDMNKDNENSPAGKMENPSTRKKMFDYAFNLAVRETELQWKNLEELATKNYPEKAEYIIDALKTGSLPKIYTKEAEAQEPPSAPKTEPSGNSLGGEYNWNGTSLYETLYVKEGKTSIRLDKTSNTFYGEFYVESNDLQYAPWKVIIKGKYSGKYYHPKDSNLGNLAGEASYDVELAGNIPAKYEKFKNFSGSTRVEGYVSKYPNTKSTDINAKKLVANIYVSVYKTGEENDPFGSFNFFMDLE